MLQNVSNSLRIVIDFRGGPSDEDIMFVFVVISVTIIIAAIVASSMSKASIQKQINEEQNLPMENAFGTIIDKQKNETGMFTTYDYIFNFGKKGRKKLRARVDLHSELSDLLVGDEGTARFYKGMLYEFIRIEKQ